MAASWSKDMKEMLLYTPDGTFRSVAIHTTPTFTASTPRSAFKSRPNAVWATPAPDCKRFLETVPVGESSPEAITVELNWMAALRKP